MRDDIKEIILKTHNYFINSRLTLSVAESCTGGLICSLLTDIEGQAVSLRAGLFVIGQSRKLMFLASHQK